MRTPLRRFWAINWPFAVGITGFGFLGSRLIWGVCLGGVLLLSAIVYMAWDIHKKERGNRATH